MTTGYTNRSPYDTNTPENTLEFFVRQYLLQNVSTMKIVKVVKVTLGEGDPPAPATVTVQPQINLLNGNNSKTENGEISGIPCLRLQAGGAAIIIDPVVGDYGILICADRDISIFKETKDLANPGSRRTFDQADGVYLPGVFGPEVTQFLQFIAGGGIKLQDSKGNVLETSEAGFVVTTAPGGDFTVNGISVTLHTHGGVTAGPPGTQTLPPTP